MVNVASMLLIVNYMQLTQFFINHFLLTLLLSKVYLLCTALLLTTPGPRKWTISYFNFQLGNWHVFQNCYQINQSH